MYTSVAQIAIKWGISERQVRDYCKSDRIPGAFCNGGVWNIPDDAEKPIRRASKRSSLLKVLQDEMESKTKGGIYHKTQIELTYNSNHIEGSRLSHDQTRYIYETNTIGFEKDKGINVDDIIETVNHFRCVDEIIKEGKKKLSEKLIKKLHYLLKFGTTDSRKSWFAVGEYKRLANEVADMETTDPKDVSKEMKKLIKWYEELDEVGLDELLEFHVRFERIHPFQDGNGRVGRLLLFKECLRHNIVPFIYEDELRFYYYRGLKEWDDEKGFLRDTSLTCQDRYKAYMDYFRIRYKSEKNSDEV